MDYVHYTRIAEYLPETGKRHHRRKEECNEQICCIHVKPLQRGKSYSRMAHENRPSHSRLYVCRWVETRGIRFPCTITSIVGQLEGTHAHREGAMFLSADFSLPF